MTRCVSGYRTPVLRELMLMVSLLPGLVQDLQAPWTPFVSATDGAQNYGYGGVKAACSPSLTRSLASAASAGDVAFLLSGVAEGDEDIVCSVPLEMKDFKTLFSIKASGAAHANKLEMGALTILVQHLARNPRLHCSRTFCLVDSLPLLYTITKGRSGAVNFRYGSRRIAAMLIATEIQPHLGYTPSRSNPGDPPSRGLRSATIRGNISSSSHEGSSQKLTNMLHQLSRSHRRLVRCGTFPSWWNLPLLGKQL